MRRVGMGILGLIGGLLAGIVIQDVLAEALVAGSGEVSTAGLVIIPVLLPLCGVAGAVIAVLADLRRERRRPGHRHERQRGGP